MVANVHAPEETQSLLDASVPDGARSTKTRGVSFARVAVGGTLLAGLAVAAVASGGGATSVAAAGASVFRLGAADASPANAASLKPKPKPTAAQIAWWKAHHPDGGAETAAAGAKKPSKDVTEKASASTASAKKTHASSSSSSVGAKESSSSSGAKEKHVTGQITPHVVEKDHQKTKKQLEEEALEAKKKAENPADKSRDMLTRLFGDLKPTKEDKKAEKIAAKHVDPEEDDPTERVDEFELTVVGADDDDDADANADEGLLENLSAEDEAKDEEALDALEEPPKKKAHAEKEKATTTTSSKEKKATTSSKAKATTTSSKAATPSSEATAPAKTSKKASKKSPAPAAEEEVEEDEDPYGVNSHDDEEEDEEEEEEDPYADTKDTIVDPGAKEKAEAAKKKAAEPEDATEAWFEEQKALKRAEEKEEKEEKMEVEAVQKKQNLLSATTKPVKPAAPDAPPEWYVAFTVSHAEKDEDIPCGEDHGPEIEEFVGQIAGSAGITPRVMHVGECQNPTARKRAYDVDFAIGDVATTPKAKASSEAKRLVKIFSNEGVADMYRANGLGEAEAKRATSAFKLETSRVKFDQRPKAELEPPDFNQPLPLSVTRAGHFNVEGPQSDAQVHRMLAQVAVNRGMPADNIPKLNFAHCPLDYRVEFDVTVAGFGCPSGEAAADGEFGRQYVAYVYKFAQLEDPPVEVPDSIQVSDCRPPAEGSERETQSLTVSFNVKRESETTNPSAAAHRILSLFSADNVRQHAADVGVSAHALHDMDLDATATAPRTRLTLDPDSRPCTLGEVVFDGKIPEGLQQPKYVSSRQQNGGAPAANPESAIADPLSGRQAMLEQLAGEMSGGFKTSSSRPTADPTPTPGGGEEQTAVQQPAAAAEATTMPTAAAATTMPAVATAATTMPDVATAATTVPAAAATATTVPAAAAATTVPAAAAATTVPATTATTVPATTVTTVPAAASATTTTVPAAAAATTVPAATATPTA